jgi:hypothetical protein
MDSSCWQLLFIYTMVLYQSDMHFFFAFLTMVDLHLNELSSLSLFLYIYKKRDIENKYGIENKDLKPFV